MKCAAVRQISAHASISRKCRGFGMFASGFEAMHCGGAETLAIAVEAVLDADFHGRGLVQHGALRTAAVDAQPRRRRSVPPRESRSCAAAIARSMRSMKDPSGPRE